ncbi:cytochrome c family protein [Sphingomonas sp. CARO-RG-8B-R24-01]|uniref:c-type cytochrome n=1 Tax=Sphingomonas sp. CARO-RG-8B-R24-01 TaxID=2914831 RepID=UPI001F568F44|nr:cytochrome c family protein [Sphingomonas sp. CARO-RG-8B-R24-01]
MKAGSMTSFGRLGFGLACTALVLTACGKKAETTDTTSTTTTTASTSADTTAPAAAPTTAAAKAPAADNTDTLAGVKLAAFTGDAKKGEADFVTCKTCHAIEAGVNKIGPSLHGVVGRAAGTIAGFSYSTANKTSGITWTPEKLFQYLENPQRVVPGTKMSFAGWPTDPQKRADVIAYLKANS